MQYFTKTVFSPIEMRQN